MKALTIGGATIDTIAVIDSDRIERMTMRNAEASFLLLEQGRKTEALEVSAHCGGGAVNAAVAMARLGLDVAALVKVGCDKRAEELMARLAEERVTTTWVTNDPKEPTGASVLISSHDRDAAIFTFRGANTLLTPADLREEAFDVDLVYVANLSNESASSFPTIVARAVAHGARVAVNPGIRQLSARAGALLDCLAKIAILALNRTEADALVPALVAKFGEGGPALDPVSDERTPALAARGLSAGGFDMSLATFFRALSDRGTECVLLTDGRAGAYAATAREIVYCPALDVEVRGTAGAGDAFAATFAAYKTLGRPTDEALRAAAINASGVVGHIDTQTGLMTAEQLEAKLAAQKHTLAVRRWPL